MIFEISGVHYFHDFLTKGKSMILKCSSCNKEIEITDAAEVKHCPDCGAELGGSAGKNTADDRRSGIFSGIWNFGWDLYRKICERFSWFHNFVLYAIIGVMAAVLDYSIFCVMNRWIGLAPELSSLIGNICGFLFTFSGNTFYNFKKSTHVLFRFISYFCITSCGMTLSTLLIHYGKNVVNLYILKAVLVLCVIPMFQFILNKKITYRDFPEDSPAFGQKSFLQKFFVLFLIASAVLWVLVPSTYHSTLHFDPAETLMWGSTFNWGSAKHPPFSGYMLYPFCRLFGFSNFAIYLLSQICVTIGFIYIYKLSRCFFERDNSVIATLLITFYFFYNYETPKFNANIPHLLFVPMMIYYFYRGCTANKWHHWLLLAVSGAAACMSKYSAGVLFAAFLLYVIINKDARRILLSIKPYAAAVLFFLLLLPHINYLIKTDFLVFNYISHGEEAKYGYFMQILIILGAVVIPLLCMSAAAAVTYLIGNRKLEKLRVSNPQAASYALCLIGGQTAFLLLMGLCGHRVLAIWTFPLFLPAGILIMSFCPAGFNDRSKKAFAVLTSLVAASLLLFALVYYNTSSKYRYHIRKADFRETAQNFYRSQTGKEIPFIIGDIWEASMLQNTMGYKVKACPASDPLLTALHREHINKNGALIICKDRSVVTPHIKKTFGTEPVWIKHTIPYRARFGKTKNYTCYLAVLPPENEIPREKKP